MIMVMMILPVSISLSLGSLSANCVLLADSLLNLMIVKVKVMIVIRCYEDDNYGSSFYLLDPTCELSVIQIPLDKGEEEPGNSI